MNQPSKLVWPTRGQAYTLDVFEKLELRDSPCLRFYHNDRLVVIQDSPGGIDELCDNAGFAATEWTFVQETDEWIPVFQYSGKRPITDFVTIEEGAASNRTGEYWVCWKGFHRPELTPFEEREAKRRFEADWEEARLVQTRQQLLEKMSKPAPEVSPHFSFKKVIDSIINPVIPKYSSEELATDPVKAEHYLMSRPKCVSEFAEKTTLVWEKIDLCSKKARLYEAGYIEQHVGWSHWGKYQGNMVANKVPSPVRFNTYECFVAWTLARFW